ncbi:IQ and AAA domain-containing protein 1-like [Teleopsis dalmanni]|uniref:IQ and AAA domain-containing protein 1-like n=1 Tax=Teleopsis dalmanni TaxID=139649 RepID=UPI0018CFE5C2|nr:IQ and AAA domain-containing protein 1-like [Teleopsis dalmanni]
MSFTFNHKFWVATRKDIQNLIKRQNVLKKMKPIQDPVLTYKIFSQLYVLYTEVVNKLGYLYSNTFQVQKRQVINGLVDTALRRLIELKEELKRLELSEYVYMDKALIARKLTPHDLVIWRSPQFLYRRPPELQDILYEHKIFMDEEAKLNEQSKILAKIGEAIIIIQAHERARRARLYKAAIKYDKKKYLIVRQPNKVKYTFSHNEGPMSIPVKRTIFNANFIKPTEECKYLTESGVDAEDEIEIDENELRRLKDEAALKIQTLWREFSTLNVVRQKIKIKQTIYGMKLKRKLVKPHERAESIMDTYKKEMLKKKLDEDFQNLIESENTRLLQERSPWIMEDISDHIRAWFREFYDKVGEFHPYPDALKGGTVLVVINETMEPIEFSEKKNKKNAAQEKAKQKEKAKQERQKEKQKLAKEKQARKKMKEAGIVDIGYEISSNKYTVKMEEIMEKYSTDWKFIDEYLNKHHEAIKEWVTDKELCQIHKDLRLLVDEYMRIEYELLRKALAADLKKKYRPTKAKKPKKKKGKGKKKKAVHDMTGDRTLESLYDELKEAKLIEKFDHKTFDNFVSEFNFVADDLRDENNLTTLGPARGDIKMVIQECMLGMGEFGVDKPKSLCIVGPPSTGKKLLSQIIASEIDALFINISPEKIFQFAEDLPYFLHVLMKVARAFQPTILFIEDAHRVFWKKIPEDQKGINPRMLQKSIAKKILKPIKKDDRIMLLGTSDVPWTAKPKFKKIFQKIILIPKSDYGSSFLLWLEFVSQTADQDVIDDYVYSALAKTFQAYNSGEIVNNVETTLNIQRRLELRQASLEPEEFVDHFIGGENSQLPLDQKIVDKYENWYKKANKYAKMRKKFLAKQQAKQKKK